MRKGNSPSVYVILAGRLGNQLFQMAAGEYLNLKSFDGKSTVIGLSSKATPKTVFNKDRSTVILNTILAKLSNYLISRSVTCMTLPDRVLLSVVKNAFEWYLGLTLRRPIKVFLSRRIADPPLQIVESGKSVVIIGYFQSYYWSGFDENIRQFLTSHLPDPLIDNQTLLRAKRDVTMHIRRTDYAQNPDLGILNGKYYLEALLRMEEMGADVLNPIIVTDDKNLSLSQFSDPQIRGDVLSPEIFDENEAFELMRNSKFLIISNSSFAWWAAYLSKNATLEKSIVFYPFPWFKEIDGIRSFPEDWRSIQSTWWESSL